MQGLAQPDKHIRGPQNASVLEREDQDKPKKMKDGKREDLLRRV
jgi:hypothetical protein